MKDEKHLPSDGPQGESILKAVPGTSTGNRAYRRYGAGAAVPGAPVQKKESDLATRGCDAWLSQPENGNSPVQLKGASASDAEAVQAAASQGVSGSGSSIPYQSRMESSFGISFSDVKAHTGQESAAATRAIGAEAFVSGNDIAFKDPNPSPALVAHELTHVVQQRAGAVSGGVGKAGDSFECEADKVAETVSSGGKTDVASKYGVGSGSTSVQRSSLQMYESSEHAQLGSETRGTGGKMSMVYPARLDGLTTLPNGAQATTGEIVAMGDFYSGIEQLSNSPRQETEALIGLVRFEGVWNLIARQKKLGGIDNSAARKKEKDRDAGLALSGDGSTNDASVKTDGERLHTTEGGHGATKAETASIAWGKGIWNQYVNGNASLGTFTELAKKIHSQFAPTWALFGMSIPIDKKPNTNVGYMRATIGRRRFRGKNDMYNQDGTADPAKMGGDYLDLASYNISHFAGNNWATYEDHHKKACQMAADAAAETDPAKKKQLETNAKITDALGCHYLTDMYAAGHMVDKQSLMSKATKMIVKAGRETMGISEDKDDHEVVQEVLTAAIKECFEDDDVRKAWIDGCKTARDMGVITGSEYTAMTGIPWGDDWANNPIGSVVANFVDVLMSMPWQKRGDTLVPSTEADRSGGLPGKRVDNGAGDYHMGAGNLAALQVHHAINEIGFSCWTVGGQGPFRMQGDGHLTAETFDTANQAVLLSKQQVDGSPCTDADLQAIKDLTPGKATINAQWVKDFYAHRGEKDKKAVFDQALIDKVVALCEKTMEKPIDLLHQGNKDVKKGSTVSAAMEEICDAIMAVEFTATPADPQNTGAKSSGTGLNISMLKQLLCEMLPGAVAATYAASSASDLPPEALELYKPQEVTTDAKGNVIGRKTLPTGANNFVWSGSNLTFDLNVTGCQPGTYEIGLQRYDRDGDMDREGSGLDKVAPSPLNPLSDSDERVGPLIKHTVTVAGTDPNAKDDKRQYIRGITVPIKAAGDEDYVVVYANNTRNFPIGNSETKESKKKGNPAKASLPKATGTDADKLAYYAATGVVGNAFNWNGNTVLFNCTTNAPNSADASVPCKVWYKTFNQDWGMDYDKKGRTDWEGGIIINRNVDPVEKQVGSVQAPVSSGKAGVFAASVTDNPGDTYVIVYADPACTIPLGRSDVQGTQRGTVKKAYSARNFVWNGNVLTFNVYENGKPAPMSSADMWVQWYDQDMGYDRDTAGNDEGWAMTDTDEPVGSAFKATWVADGLCIATASGKADDENDTYGVIYQDRAKKIPLGRSNTQGTNRGKLRNLPVTVKRIRWVGATLVFDVMQGDKPASDGTHVYVRLFDKDSGWDHDASGNKLSDVWDTDEQYGATRTISVRGGKGRITVGGDANHGDTYGVVYLDAGGRTPLIRSGTKG